MLRTILFGPSSLNSEKKKPNSPKTAGTMWGVSGVTPGAIAGVSVLVSIMITVTLVSQSGELTATCF